MYKTCLLSLPLTLPLTLLMVSVACTTPLVEEGSGSETSAEGQEDPTTSGDGDGDMTGDGDGDTTTTTTSTAPTDTTSGGDPLTIYELQQGADDGSIGEGQNVTIASVIMTSPATVNDAALMWVEESGAGEWSGVSIYVWEEAREGLDLTPGAEVSFTGEYVEQFGLTQVIVKNPGDITVDSSGNDVPGPDTVTGADVAFDSLASEPWESVHVCVEGATILDSNDGFGQYEIDDGTGSAKVGNLFFADPGLPEVATGGTFERVCGVLNISFDEYKIQPRGPEDLVGYAAPMATDSTIFDIQMGNVSEGSVVRLTDVVATSGYTWSDDVDASFFVQEGSGEFEGIQIYVADTTGLAIVPGDVLTIEGTYTEFFDMSQVSSTAESIMVTGNGPAPAPTVVDDPMMLVDGPTAEAYEGCLVQVNMVTVLDDLPDAPDDFGEFTVTGGLRIDDAFFAMQAWMKPPVDTVFDSIAGIHNYAFGNYKLEPRSPDDLVMP